MQTEETNLTLESALTVGQMMRSAREALGLQHRDLAAVTKIQPAMLKFIEEDRFEEFPAEVFARGFVRNYARELRLDVAAVMAAYDVQRGALRKPVAAEPVATAAPIVAPSTTRAAAATTPFSDIAHFFEQGKAGRVVYAVAVALLVVGLALSVLVFSSSNSSTGTAAFEPMGEQSNDVWRPAPDGQSDWRTYRQN